MKVAILGTGYVGLTTGVALAYLGHDVHCLDVDTTKIEQLKAGQCPIFEPHLVELMELSASHLHFTTKFEEAIPNAEVVFIAVGTPSLPDGSPNLTYLRSAAQKVGEFLSGEYVVVVNKSTVPIGSGNWVDSLVRDAYKVRKSEKKSEFQVASNPEFLREGSALADTLFADRVVVGADQSRAINVLQDLYRPILEQTFDAPVFLPRPEGFNAVPFISSDLPSAELIKYSANAFLALKISFINEMAELAEKVGADITHVARGIGLDSRIGSRFLQAGLGWGGSCFGKDTAALASTGQEYGLKMQIVRAARDVNARQRQRVCETLLSELKILKGRTIGLLGLAFKPFTDDLRDAPALEIAKRLIDLGAKVKGFDPVALERAHKEWKDAGIQFVKSAEETFEEADAMVLVTEWPEFKSLDWQKCASLMKGKLVLDGRNSLDLVKLAQAGLKGIGMGKSV